MCQPAAPSPLILHRNYSGLSAPSLQCCMGGSHHPQGQVLHLLPSSGGCHELQLVGVTLPGRADLLTSTLNPQTQAVLIPACQDWDKCPELWMVEMRSTTLYPLAPYVPSTHSNCRPTPPPKEKDRRDFLHNNVAFLTIMLDGSLFQAGWEGGGKWESMDMLQVNIHWPITSRFTILSTVIVSTFFFNICILTSKKFL